jgi:hypothetical protein
MCLKSGRVIKEGGGSGKAIRRLEMRLTADGNRRTVWELHFVPFHTSRCSKSVIKKFLFSFFGEHSAVWILNTRFFCFMLRVGRRGREMNKGCVQQYAL